MMEQTSTSTSVTSAQATGGLQAGLREGQIFAGRYRVQKLLGEGGIGVVYQVSHMLSGKVMALKVLHNHVMEHRTQAVGEFFTEIRKLARLSHPHTMELFDCGTSDDELFLVMEYLPGIDLEKLLSTEVQLPWTLVLEVGEQACGALEHAHSQGLLHRNLKPANMMLMHYQGEENFTKLLDFGLTTSVEAAQKKGVGENPFVGDTRYAAPEQVKGARPSAQADIYSLAAVLYEMMVRRPYWQDLEQGKAFALEREDAALLKPLLDVLRRCLAQDPQERPATVEELRALLLEAQKSLVLKTDAKAPTEDADAFDMPAPSDELPSLEEVLSRQEWERTERLWRWRARSRWIVLFVLFAGGIGWFGTRFVRQAEQKKQEAAMARKFHTQEREPNNDVRKATRIKRNTWIKGQLGKPLADMSSDHDWFRFSLPDKEQFVQIRLLPPKLLDVELGVYQLHENKQAGRYTKKITPLEVFKSNSGQRGDEEQIPPTRMAKGDYYLLVRELTVLGEKPQSNLGSYRLIVKVVKPKPDEEQEPNGQVSKASPAQIEKTMTGIHAESGDIDFFSLELPSHADAAKRWRDCKDCPKHKRRWSYYRKVFKDAPIYMLRFEPVPGVNSKLTLLNEKIQPITVLKEADMFKGLPRHLKHKKPKKGAKTSEKSPHILYLFTGTGRHYLRVETQSGHHYQKPYRWKISYVPIR